MSAGDGLEGRLASLRKALGGDTSAPRERRYQLHGTEDAESALVAFYRYVLEGDMAGP